MDAVDALFARPDSFRVREDEDGNEPRTMDAIASFQPRPIALASASQPSRQSHSRDAIFAEDAFVADEDDEALAALSSLPNRGGRNLYLRE